NHVSLVGGRRWPQAGRGRGRQLSQASPPRVVASWAVKSSHLKGYNAETGAQARRGLLHAPRLNPLHSRFVADLHMPVPAERVFVEDRARQLTVIIPAYNEAASVADTIRSV